MQRAAGRVGAKLYALTLSAAGLVLVLGGTQLLLLGGSPYYLLAGLATLASGALVWRRDRRAAAVFGAMLAVSVAWSIWEAGWDGWALAARLVAPLILGLGFLSPSIRSRPIEEPAPARGWLVLALGFAAAVMVGAAARTLGPVAEPDPLWQEGSTGSIAAAIRAPQRATDGEWLNYGNDAGGTRFSALDQLTPTNVANLKVAWQVHLGNPAQRNLEVTPLKVGDTLYVCTANNDVLAVDAENGHIRWRFRSGISVEGRPSATCRGVAYYRVPDASGPCAARIVTNTIDARLIALDAATGRPCATFGRRGQVDLTTGMGLIDRGYYYVSSAPTIVRGKIVLGGWVSDGQSWGEPSGVIRAYDAATGAFAWAFDMGRPDRTGEPGPGETYTRSTPNSWAPMSADPELGLVYAPTGNATPDYFGAQRRPFDDRYSSAVVALDAATGKVRWSYQTVHHDLWDYDVASQPTLVDIPGPGGVRRALVQPTKRGEVFLLDRVTGIPIATVAERPVPQAGGMADDRHSPTQPFSTGMPSFAGPKLHESDMWGLTPLDQLWCRIKFRQARYEGTMTPPGLTPNIVQPGYLGGMDWGSAAVDPERGVLIVNSNRVTNYDRLVPRADADRLGIKPSVKGGPRAYNGVVAQAGTPYAADIQPFLSPLGAPCNKPPYGLITAIDLRSHKVVWSHPLGTARDSGPFGLSSMLPFTLGTPNAGGSVVTRGGLVFIAATQERALRALDVRTGAELWKVRLPAGGQATPMTYRSPRSGRQFVAIAAGGNVPLRSRQGDYLVAYALPQ